VANPLIASKQASKKEPKCPDKKRGIAPNNEKDNQPRLTVKKVCIQEISFLIGKKINKINPKAPLRETPITKSKKGELSAIATATRRGTNIKKLKPKINLPRRFKIVDRSFLVGEITIIKF
jgi:hypothetical protein